ncbi:PREDICTED: uncharacterized protein LOC104709489 [Camelina sativa]|uniref:Uncharacterized protein LOC104709489 n=1 Tax=Camelina sativa TaxID=90675 RepID=A0ABM0TCW6_CAMSA|nr:PREDICTED: uncharacterized protein LOC104709489 [Camelina sativa]
MAPKMKTYQKKGSMLVNPEEEETFQIPNRWMDASNPQPDAQPNPPPEPALEQPTEYLSTSERTVTNPMEVDSDVDGGEPEEIQTSRSRSRAVVAKGKRQASKKAEKVAERAAKEEDRDTEEESHEREEEQRERTHLASRRLKQKEVETQAKLFKVLRKMSFVGTR